jgi:leucine dehydrogenase
MSYKNAVAGLKFGGGKAVILASHDAPKSPELFRTFGRCVNSIGGDYVTAEDVGCSVDDMRYVHEVTEYVSGLPQSGHDAGGDPSPWTALGCFQGIKAAGAARLGSYRMSIATISKWQPMRYQPRSLHLTNCCSPTLTCSRLVLLATS